jgi:FkbM family methyltransferase
MTIKSLLKKAFRKMLTPLLWDYSSAELQCTTTSFSQFGEDVICSYLFENSFKGYNVEVGAFHPMSLSNTYAFYRKGWRGIAIDANPQVEQLFKRFRPEDEFIHTAVGCDSGSVEMYLFEDGAFNCTADQIQNVPEWIRGKRRKVIVPIKPLSEILHKNNVLKIDYLSVDCEGNDFNVLMSNDWLRWKPRVVCVEDHDLQWQQSQIAVYLQSLGYILKYRAGFSSIFVPIEIFDSICADKLTSHKVKH